MDTDGADSQEGPIHTHARHSTSASVVAAAAAAPATQGRPVLEAGGASQAASGEGVLLNEDASLAGVPHLDACGTDVVQRRCVCTFVCLGVCIC